MEALVNTAYDRISEDVILLYDAMLAYNQAPAPKPPVSVILQAMYRSLMKDHSEKAMGHSWHMSHEDLAGRGMSHRLTSTRGDTDAAEDGFDEINGDSEDGDELEGVMPLEKESQLLEFARFLVTSVLSDLAVTVCVELYVDDGVLKAAEHKPSLATPMPFWTVKLSAIAHRGRLPELWPFIGYRQAIMAIIQLEGPGGLFRAWGPICAAGLLRYFRRSKLLYTDYYWKTTHRVTTRFIMQAEKYTRHVNDPEVLAQSYEGFASRMLWASILHPFDLLATRMITESIPEYDTMASAIQHVVKHRGVSGLFLGVRSSIFNVILPFGNWYLLGVPFLIKTRRTLDGMDTVFRAGMGGSLDMIRAILKEEGFRGLFAGYRATLWGIVPAFASLCGARLVVYMIMGSSRRTRAHRRKRNAHLRYLMRTSQSTSPSTSLATNNANADSHQQLRVDEGRPETRLPASGDGHLRPNRSRVTPHNASASQSATRRQEDR